MNPPMVGRDLLQKGILSHLTELEIQLQRNPCSCPGSDQLGKLPIL